MKKILIITYYWPPSGGAGVQRWLKFAKYLPECDIKPIILTVDSKYAAYFQTDQSLKNDIHPDLIVCKTKSFEPLNILSKLIGKKNIPYGGFANVNKNSLLQTILRFIRGNLFIPDARIGWNKYAYKKAKDIITEYNIDTVITTSPPHSTQLVGLKLKKKFNIYWIADFRDPWTDIYYYLDLLHSKIVKWIDKRKEIKVLKSADKVITVGKSLSNYLYNKILQRKFSIICNGFDPDDFTGRNYIKPKIFTITYTGTLSDQYNISVFIDACHECKAQGNDFIIRFVGKVTESKLTEFSRAGLKNNIEIVNYVPHLKSIEYLLSSSVLLLVIPEFKGNDVILTGKLFEYLAARKIIIGLGPKNGDSNEIIKDCDAGRMFSGKDSTELKEYLMDLVRLWEKNNDLNIKNNCYLKYSRKKLTEKLADIINISSR